jgi:hypothetical protein
MNGVTVTISQGHIAGADRQFVYCSATAFLYFLFDGFPLSAAFDTPNSTPCCFAVLSRTRQRAMKPLFQVTRRLSNYH